MPRLPDAACMISYTSRVIYVNAGQARNTSNLTIHGIRLLKAAFLQLNLSNGTQGAEADITVANHLLACLTTCLQGQLNP